MTRKNLRDGGWAGHPHGAEIVDGISAFHIRTRGEHLTELQSLLALHIEALAQTGAELVELRAGRGEQATLLMILPEVADVVAHQSEFLLCEFGEAIEGCLNALTIDGG